MNNKYLVVGIAGKIRSGKDTLANLMIEKGFYGVSLGDIVREKTREFYSDQESPISIENMTKTSNRLRSEMGPDFLYKEAISKYEKLPNKSEYKGLLMFSVRAPIEADSIVGSGGRLIWVEASDEERYGRAVKFKRDGETTQTFDEFKIAEAEQFKPNPELPKEIQMDLDYVKTKATDILSNDKDIETFNEQASNLIEGLSNI